jgi:hypothetical protein
MTNFFPIGNHFHGNSRSPVFRTTTIATIPAVFEFFAGFGAPAGVKLFLHCLPLVYMSHYT